MIIVLSNDEIYCAMYLPKLSQHLNPLLSQLKSSPVPTARHPEVYVTSYPVRTVVFVLRDRNLLTSPALVLTSGLVCCYVGKGLNFVACNVAKITSGTFWSLLMYIIQCTVAQCTLYTAPFIHCTLLIVYCLGYIVHFTYLLVSNV